MELENFDSGELETIYLTGDCFWGVQALEYHQNYLEKNSNGYRHVDLSKLEAEAEIDSN
jgi:peptide methionine sulfoxide reductase MsrA